MADLAPDARYSTATLSGSSTYNVPYVSASEGDGVVLFVATTGTSFTTYPTSFGWTAIGGGFYYKIMTASESNPLPCAVSPWASGGVTISYLFDAGRFDWSSFGPQFDSIHNFSGDNTPAVSAWNTGTPDLHPGGDTCWLHYCGTDGGGFLFYPASSEYDIDEGNHHIISEGYSNDGSSSLAANEYWTFSSSPWGSVSVVVVPGLPAVQGGGFGAFGL